MNFRDLADSASPMGIVLGADPVVQAIVAAMLLVSLASWSIMLGRIWAIAVERRHTLAAARALSAVANETDLVRLCEMSDGQVNRILQALKEEWHWSNANAADRYDRMKDRVLAIGDLAIATEMRQLAGRTALLATIGSVSPFIGLFGTVWGIMGSFLAIGAAQDTALAVVAPGIAEALMATAVGLFAAIPAVIGYNRLLQQLGGIDASWRAIVGQLEIAISRHFEGRP